MAMQVAKVWLARYASYYNSYNKTANSQFIGSWAKRTRVRPPRDVDILYVLPSSVYERYQSRQGNRQSQILQEVKGVLARQFGSTSIKGSGPVVVVPFTAYQVEVAPVFRMATGQFSICMTDGGGYYKLAAYDAEADFISTSSVNSKGNTRDLIRMMKMAGVLLCSYQVVPYRDTGGRLLIDLGTQGPVFGLL